MAYDPNHLTLLVRPKTEGVRRERRSKRVKLSLPVAVHGKTVSGETFHEQTHTLSVSAHGGLVLLGIKVPKEQTVLVENLHTRGQQECRVVYLSHSQNGKWPVGIEFKQSAINFWQIYFPPISPSPTSSTKRIPQNSSISTTIRRAAIP